MFVHTVLSVCLDSTHSFSLYPSYFFGLFPTCNQVIICQNRAQFWHVMAYLLGSLIIQSSPIPLLLSLYLIPLSCLCLCPSPPPRFFAPPPLLSLSHTHTSTQSQRNAHTYNTWTMHTHRYTGYRNWPVQKWGHTCTDTHKNVYTKCVPTNTNTQMHLHIHIFTCTYRPIHARFMKSAWKNRLVHRGYPAKRAVSVMRKHGG